MNRKMMTAALAGLMMAGTFASQAMADENTISLMLMGTEADSFVDDYVEIINNFNETNEYGVTVNAEFYENEQMKTKLATLMAANNAPDVFFTYELAYLEPFVNGGKVADLTDYLENDPEWKSTFSEGTLELLEYDGRNFAIPTQISLCVMFYNKQIFADNGLEIPKTYEEFLQVCDTLKNNGVVPMAMSGADAWIPAQFVQQLAGGMAGTDLFYGIVDGTEQWNNETHVKAAEEVVRLAEEGYFQDGYIGMTPEETTEMFLNGNAAMYFQGTWDATTVTDRLGENGGAFVMPAYDSQYDNISVGSLSTSFAVSEKCANKDAAVALLKYWTSLEVQEKLLYGSEKIPAINVEIQEDQLSPLMKDIIGITNESKGMTPWWDRQFGAEEGVEFNNTCVAILGGEDAQDAFDALQEYAEDNADR